MLQTLFAFDSFSPGQPVLADCFGCKRRGVFLEERGEWARVQTVSGVVNYKLAELTPLDAPFVPVGFDCFYLGTHLGGWLWGDNVPDDVPLFPSIQCLRRIKKWKRTKRRFSLDSGGFTELQKFGTWTVTPEQYVEELGRVEGEVGPPDWVAQQDWMCEPIVIQGGKAGPITFAGTGLSVEAHQDLTVDNFIRLKTLRPSMPIMPVLQGYRLDDYLRCRDKFAARGIDLTKEPHVGFGSVCRRESTAEVAAIFRRFNEEEGVKTGHGFGVKGAGLSLYARWLKSADSLAWSFNARKNDPLPECVAEGKHQNCSNCPRWALMWREKVLASL